MLINDLDFFINPNSLQPDRLQTNFNGGIEMRLIEWEVKEDDYQEQINIPSEQRKMAEEEGISTDHKQRVAV